MSRKLQLAGERFGRLKVIREIGTDKNGKTVWECQCDCGNSTSSIGSNLVSGKSMSCGCIKNEIASARARKHGMGRTKIYSTWQNMKQRCYNEKCKSYKDYGARGIEVCPEWLNNPKSFFDWAMANGYDKNLTIERKDVNGNYCPENCCWISHPEQAKNKTVTKRIGERELALDVARENFIPPSTMYSRIRRGMSARDSVSKNNFKKKRIQQIEIESGKVINTYKSVREAARAIKKSCSDISLCANGKLNKAYGYIWRFAE